MSLSYTCPYCFETRGNIVFRCITPTCERHPDEALGNYLRQSPPPLELRVLEGEAAPWGPPRHATCPDCKGKSTKVICPGCHNELPSQFHASKSVTIALLGAKNVGKSHYVAVLVHELTHNLGERFNATLNALDEQTRRRYRNDFQRHLYQLRETIPVTRSARADNSVRYPLVYRFSVERRRFFFLRQLRVSSVVFFDTAGEDLQHDDTMAVENRYIANSEGLIFLLDPLQIPTVRQELGLPDEGPGDDPREIMIRAAELIRKQRGLRADQKITTPVALTFSKIDAVRPLLGPDSPINRASNHFEHFNLSDAEVVSETIRAFIKHWLGPDFHQTVAHNFSDFQYFGVSALGNPPEDGRLAKGVQSFRVEDPFLWLLHRKRMISGKK